MKFELAATNASQSRNPQAGALRAPTSLCRPAPFAASLEVEPWMFSEFNVPIESPVPAPPASILGREPAKTGGSGIYFALKNGHEKAQEAQGTNHCPSAAPGTSASGERSLSLSLPARDERGESRREGFSNKSASSPRPSPLLSGRRGSVVAHPESRRGMKCNPPNRKS